MLKEIIHKALLQAYTYTEYKQHIITLYDRGELTSGDTTDEMLHYTKLNIARMSRLEKTFTSDPELIEALKQLPEFQILVITEGWCGDAAQLAGAFDIMNRAVNGKGAQFVLRDQNLELMDLFLTNGKSRSIPIAIFWTGEEVLFHYGPRPIPAQKLLDELKAMDTDLEKQKTELHKWYAQDKWVNFQAEILSLIEKNR
jgi:hypothetical protein